MQGNTTPFLSKFSGKISQLDKSGRINPLSPNKPSIQMSKTLSSVSSTPGPPLSPQCQSKFISTGKHILNHKYDTQMDAEPIVQQKVTQNYKTQPISISDKKQRWQKIQRSERRLVWEIDDPVMKRFYDQLTQVQKTKIPISLDTRARFYL